VVVSAPLPQSVPNGSYGGARIKTESAYDSSSSSYAQFRGPTLNTQLAQQRAANLLQTQYGQQAAASIAAAQSQQTGLSLPGQQRPVGLQLPGQGGQQPHAQSQYQQQQQQQQQQRSSLGTSQTDGAGDAMEEWTAVVSEQRARPDSDRVVADRTIRSQIEEAARMMETGLMLPLDELRRPSGKKQRRLLSNIGASSAENPSAATANATPRIPQLDGTIDKEEEDDDSKPGLKVEADEDAINSDLDDSEDELRDNQDDGEDAKGGDYVLCTYDKVQRVKDKWKATLKDGVIQIASKEYVIEVTPVDSFLTCVTVTSFTKPMASTSGDRPTRRPRSLCATRLNYGAHYQMNGDNIPIFCGFSQIGIGDYFPL